VAEYDVCCRWGYVIYLPFLLLDLVILLCLLIPSFSAVFYFLGFAEYTEVSSSTLQPDNDPLMAAVSLLEANWISVWEIFELVNHVLTRIFIGLC
jgi:hypothetical protein